MQVVGLGESQVWVKCAFISRCLLRKCHGYFLELHTVILSLRFLPEAFFLPQDKNFSSWGVSFLGQKRAVGKRGGISAKLFFKRCLVLRAFDAYQMRMKIFFLLGLPFTPPYLRIYESILQVVFRQEVMVTSITLKIFLSEA